MSSFSEVSKAVSIATVTLCFVIGIRARKKRSRKETNLWCDKLEATVCDRSEVFTVKYTFCNKNVIPLWVADSDLPTAPCIQDALIKRSFHPTYGYTIQPPELWSSIASWLLTRHSWKVEPEEFVFTGTLVTATVNCLQAFTQENDAVGVLLPLYFPLQKLVEKTGRRLVPMELLLNSNGELRYEIDWDEIRRICTTQKVRALIWCSPQNPSGKVWSIHDLRQLVRLCRELNVLIISDEVHSDLILWGRKHIPVAVVAKDLDYVEGVVTLSSPGKTWNLAGLHAGFVVLQSQNLRAKYMKVVEHAYLHYGSTFATTGMLAAYTQGGPWLDKCLLPFLESNILFLEQFIEAKMPFLRVMRPEASFLVWIDFSGLGLDAVDGGSNSSLYRFLLEEARIMLSDGFSFGGVKTASFMRINVACRRIVLNEALVRLRDAVRRCGLPVPLK